MGRTAQFFKPRLKLIKEREEKRLKINWQFSLGAARKKLNSHYAHVNAENDKYKETQFPV
jgi:hypothetical protein